MTVPSIPPPKHVGRVARNMAHDSNRRDFLCRVALLGLLGGSGCANNSSSYRLRVGFFSSAGADLHAQARVLRSALINALPAQVHVDLVSHFRETPAAVKQIDVSELDVAIAATGELAIRLQSIAPELPLLFACGSDPVAEGLAESYERPNRGASGFTYESPVDGARAERLASCLPLAKKVGVIVDGWYLAKPENLQPISAAFEAFGCTIRVANCERPESLGPAVSQFKKDSVDAVYFPVSVAIDGREAAAVEATARHQLPAMYPYAKCVDLGGLMSYEASIPDPFEILARQCAMIQRGVSAGEIPIESPRHFVCALNFVTARRLSLNFPDSVILDADRFVSDVMQAG